MLGVVTGQELGKKQPKDLCRGPTFSGGMWTQLQALGLGCSSFGSDGWTVERMMSLFVFSCMLERYAIEAKHSSVETAQYLRLISIRLSK
jgi:hypothetical protein